MTAEVLRPDEIVDRAMTAAGQAIAGLLEQLVSPIDPAVLGQAVVALSDLRADREPAGAGVARSAVAEVARDLLDVVGRMRVYGAADGSRPARPTDEAWEALSEGRLDDAARLAGVVLAALPDEKNERDPLDGHDIHHANLVLGHIALLRGDVAAAEEHLLAAGRTAGSPALNTFGPNMSLALALLRQGRVEPVRAFFGLCAAFWHDRGQLARWEEALDAGSTPPFGPNLVYGTGQPRVARCALCRAPASQAGTLVQGPSGSSVCRICAWGTHTLFSQTDTDGPPGA